ncbi:hypothetical protein Btru_042937 [Bulinus truncatus]|nr:hypothetical protein Btru_042937 [Bulinus truncatus]
MDAYRRLVLILAAACFLKFTASNPVIEINPKVLNPALTKALDVECTFQRGYNFAFLFSLVLMHSKTSSNNHFSHLVSVSSTYGLINGTSLRPPFTISGAVNNTSVSYVKISWSDPGQDKAGVYKCEAHGHDVAGRPVSAASSESLQTKSPTIEMVILEMRGLEGNLNSLKLNLSNCEDYLNGELKTILSGVNQTQTNLSNSVNRVMSEISSVRSTVSNVQSRLASLEIQTSGIKNYQDRVSNNMATSRQAMFISSGYYQGRRYWLTRYSSLFNPTYSQTICMTYGGYLAEVNTNDELQFLRNFVMANGWSFSFAMLGGTDEGHEGRWLYMHSRTLVPSLWYPRQPDNAGGTEHCQCLYKFMGWGLNDYVCSIAGEFDLYVKFRNSFIYQELSSNPVIEINPKVLNPALTKALDVECTFQRGYNFAFLFSLVLMHSKTSSNNHFSHLVSVSSTYGLINGTSLRPPFTISGAVNNTSVSYVKISWSDPGQDKAGVYKCEAHGHDVAGRPVSAASSESLQTKSPTIEMVILEMRGLEGNLNSLKLNLSNCEDYLNGELKTILSGVNQTQTNLSNSVNRVMSEISSVRSTVSNVQSRLASLEIQTSGIKNYQDRVSNNMATSRQAMFISSGYYQGRRYWLTRYSSLFNPTYSQTICMTYGGYLAEVNTNDELQFLRNFVMANGWSFSFAMLGGTDEGHEGRWLYMHSRTLVPSLWYPRQPDNAGGTEHCQCLYKFMGWGLNDYVCSIAGGVRFVCEIPE